MLHPKITLLSALTVLLLSCVSAWAGPIGGVTVDAANHQGDFVSSNLVDGDPSTAWVGGGKGVGPGKWIELTFPAPVKLEALSIATGHQGKGQFSKFRRLVRGVIIYPDETRQKFTLKPSAGVQRIRLQPKTVDSLKIIITGVEPATADKAMGKAKVAVSEISVVGEMVGEPLLVTDGDTPEPAEQAKKGEAKPEAATKPKPEVKPEPTPKPKAKPAPKPEVKAKPAPKPAPKPKVKVKPEPKPAAKTATAPAKVEAPKPKAKPAPARPVAKKNDVKKSTPKKAAPKKKAKKKAAKAKPKAASIKGAAITRLRPAVEVPADKDLAMGVINPWLDLELVAEIKRYLGLLTTLHDSYPDLFVPAIRERERAAFLKLQESVRAKKEFGGRHMAMLEHIGLSFDKPVMEGDRATVRVHGPYRYYIEKKAYEFQVDADVTLVRQDGRWLIKDVRDK